jgi:hypothetical protein
VRKPKLVPALVAAVVVGLGAAAPGYAAGESFRVVSVNATGCASGAFAMTVERANLDGGSYTAHTMVRAAGKIYMNENATISVNGLTGWNLFNNFSYGAVPNPGTWPIPQNTQLRIDFMVERPVGTVLWAWRTVVNSCYQGAILYNGLASADTDKDFIPTPADKCPKLSATSANGCPARTLTIGYDAGAHKFIGWLFATGFPKLYSRKTVTIWKAKKGPDKRIGKTRTTKRGNYTLARDPGPGSYYATAGKVGPVPKETSLAVRVR